LAEIRPEATWSAYMSWICRGCRLIRGMAPSRTLDELHNQEKK